MKAFKTFITWSWPFIVVSIFIMLPILMMPFGQDHASFLRGGRILLDGGRLYIDFIDVKPPIIYLMFGIGEKIFGSSELALRTFDIIFQSATIVLLAAALRRIGSRPVLIWSTCVLYATLYTISGYSQISQAESFFALAISASIYASTLPHSTRRDVILGFSTFFAFFLKYTLGIIAPAFILAWWLSERNTRQSITTCLRSGATFIVLSCIMIAAFYMRDGSGAAIADMTAYLKVYSTTPPYDMMFVTFMVHEIGTFLGDNIGIVVSTLIALGIAIQVRTTTPAYDKRMLASLTIVIVLLFATLVLERKFTSYQMARLLVPMAVFCGYAITVATPYFRNSWNNQTRNVKAGIYLMLIPLFFATPLPRYTNVCQLALRSISDKSVYNNYLTRPEVMGMDYNSIDSLRTDLHRRLVPTDTVMIISMMATPILPWLPSQNMPPFSDPHFYLGRGVRDSWRTTARNWLSHSDWVVVDTVDQCPGMTLHKLTSWGSLCTDTLLLPVLTDRFERVDTVGTCFIYKRKS